MKKYTWKYGIVGMAKCFSFVNNNTLIEQQHHSTGERTQLISVLTIFVQEWGERIEPLAN